ncbi:uncharacterized protein LACBIDRAFT_304778 [Laccaria bicolor S238N-H82]|uniref:Predicted protein n=1 Tax=Laccaria bicolor (strain S238N-H82 / ATCC MYA-4686) TaxID=486041 RepID=B0DMB2_LACBS|nr:uncharacterized protein LACBIDRAFT_304778 [Laccaria bicolor S238N-H82]EDR04165.1 predicted protein [Laccaria bicolor S238N-H82]|eukprot:XP_001885056.1 predicted protein [Laccaria bicolor S238N-H82]
MGGLDSSHHDHLVTNFRAYVPRLYLLLGSHKGHPLLPVSHAIERQTSMLANNTLQRLHRCGLGVQDFHPFHSDTHICRNLQLVWTCQARNKWSLDHSMCVLPTRIAIIQLTTDVVGDAIRLVWRTTLSKPQKIRIITILSTTIIMTAVSLNHAFTVMLNGGGLTEALASLLQSSISAIVCNFNAIITFIFHIATEDPNLSPPSKPMSSLRFGFKSKTTGGGVRIELRQLPWRV